MSVKTISIRTAADGSYTYERSFKGVINAIEVLLGEAPNALSTPDVDVTDDTYSLTVLSVDGVAADTVYQPTAALGDTDGTSSASAVGALAVMGVLKVAVTGGGDTKRGRINIHYT